jgi:hypothetical protein
MKHIILSILLITICSCSSNKDFFQLECVSIQEDYVVLSISNAKKPENLKFKSISKNAIKGVLFNGYASTVCKSQPALLRNENEINNFKKIEKRFFSNNGDWKQFLKNVPTTNSQSNTIMVNKSLLRKYLETKSIISPLGQGF